MTNVFKAIVRPVIRRCTPTAFLVKRRHRDSWKNLSIVDEMLVVAREALREPESVPPFRTFIETMNALVGAYRLVQPARLLDFGCGVGHYSEMLERYFPGRFLYTGCDYAPEMIEAARVEWPGRNFVVNDLFANSLDLAAFDVVLAGGLVDITPEYERALAILLGSKAPYVILHRQEMTSGPSRWEVRPGYKGQTTFRTYLNREEFEEIAERHGRKIAQVFRVDDEIHTFLLVATPGR